MDSSSDETTPTPAESGEPFADAGLVSPSTRISDDVLMAEIIEKPARPPHPHIGWALLWVLLFWVVQFLAGIPVALFAVAKAFASGARDPEEINQALNQNLADVTVWMIPVGTFVSVLWAVAVAAFFYQGQLRQRLALRGMAIHQWVTTLLLVLPLAILASEVTNWASELRDWILAQLPELAEAFSQMNMEVLGEFAEQPWPLVVVAACLFPAIGEEIYCRGFLGRGLVGNHGVVWGVLLTSLLFGIMHLEPVQSTGACALGLGLHYVYLTTRSILAPMLIHLLNNAFAFWTFRNYEAYPIPGVTPMPDGSLSHTPPLLLITAALAALCLSILLYQTRTRWRLSNGNEWSPGYATAEEPPSTLAASPRSHRPTVAITLLCLVSYAALIGSMYAAHTSVNGS